LLAVPLLLGPFWLQRKYHHLLVVLLAVTKFTDAYVDVDVVKKKVNSEIIFTMITLQFIYYSIRIFSVLAPSTMKIITPGVMIFVWIGGSILASLSTFQARILRKYNDLIKEGEG